MNSVTTYPEIVGRVLAGLRKQKRLKQSRLAEAVGVAQSSWSKIERGETSATVEHLGIAADVMGMSPGEIAVIADKLAAMARDSSIRVACRRLETGLSIVTVSSRFLDEMLKSILEEADAA